MSKFLPQYSKKDFEVHGVQLRYAGFAQIKSYQVRFRLFNGGWSSIATREMYERTNAVGVLLFDPDREQIVLIEQFRIGAIQDPNSPWLFELVAGIIDSEDTLEEIARRETREEANLEILDLIPICRYWASPGTSTEQVSLFCGKIDASKAGGVYGLSSEHEDIKVHVLDAATAFEAIQEGAVNNAAAIIALQWLQLHYNTVKKQWRGSTP